MREEPIRATCGASGVLGLLGRYQALLRETHGSSLAPQVQLQGHIRLEYSQDGHGSRSPGRKGAFLFTISPLPFPAPMSDPILVLYYDYQFGSWFSSYRFSFSFSKLLALGSS